MTKERIINYINSKDLLTPPEEYKYADKRLPPFRHFIIWCKLIDIYSKNSSGYVPPEFPGSRSVINPDKSTLEKHSNKIKKIFEYPVRLGYVLDHIDIMNIARLSSYLSSSLRNEGDISVKSMIFGFFCNYMSERSDYDSDMHEIFIPIMQQIIVRITFISCEEEKKKYENIISDVLTKFFTKNPQYLLHIYATQSILPEVFYETLSQYLPEPASKKISYYLTPSSLDPLPYYKNALRRYKESDWYNEENYNNELSLRKSRPEQKTSKFFLSRLHPEILENSSLIIYSFGEYGKGTERYPNFAKDKTQSILLLSDAGATNEESNDAWRLENFISLELNIEAIAKLAYPVIEKALENASKISSPPPESEKIGGKIISMISLAFSLFLAMIGIKFITANMEKELRLKLFKTRPYNTPNYSLEEHKLSPEGFRYPRI